MNCVFVNGNQYILIQISLTLVPLRLRSKTSQHWFNWAINNMFVIFWLMPWHNMGDNLPPQLSMTSSHHYESIIFGRNGTYFTWVATSYRGEARGLWIYASPRERSLVKFHLSASRIWKGFSPWGNRGSVACHLLRMKTSATYPQPQVASWHLDGTWTRRPSPLSTAILVWYGEQPRGKTPRAESRGRTQDLPHGKPVTYH